jgi:hypothetical protein
MYYRDRSRQESCGDIVIMNHTVSEISWKSSQINIYKVVWLIEKFSVGV